MRKWVLYTKVKASITQNPAWPPAARSPLKSFSTIYTCFFHALLSFPLAIPLHSFLALCVGLSSLREANTRFPLGQNLPVASRGLSVSQPLVTAATLF